MTTNAMTPQLSSAQARRLCEKIVSQATDLRGLMLQLRDGEGWVALGYATWDKCCETEFGYSKRHANRLIQAAEISQQVGPIGPTEPLPESHARELGRVPEESRQDVLDLAEEKADGKPVTAATIRRAAVEVLDEPDDEPEEEDEAEDEPDLDEDEPAPSNNWEWIEKETAELGKDIGNMNRIVEYIDAIAEEVDRNATVAFARLENLSTTLKN